MPEKSILKNSVIVLFMLFLFSSCASVIKKDISKVKDFEQGNLHGWNQEKSQFYSIQIVNNPVRSGNYSSRFEVRKGDMPYYDRRRRRKVGRAELSEHRYFTAPFNTDLWYRFSTFIPKDWPNERNRCLIAQWHGVPDFGEEWRSPPLGIEYRFNQFYIRICYSKKRIQHGNTARSNNKTPLYRSYEYAKKGVWHDFVINVKWSYKEDGYLNVWIDNNRVVRYRGPIGYNDRVGLFFKMGIYRDISEKTYVLYHDDYRRGISPSDIGIENPLSISWLTNDLDNSNLRVRENAMADLAEIEGNRDKVIPAFIKALDDDDWFLRRKALMVLREDIGSECNEYWISTLVKALKDENEFVRGESVEALAECYAINTKIIKILQDVANEDDDDYVRKKAIEALNKIN